MQGLQARGTLPCLCDDACLLAACFQLQSALDTGPACARVFTCSLQAAAGAKSFFLVEGACAAYWNTSCRLLTTSTQTLLWCRCVYCRWLAMQRSCLHLWRATACMSTSSRPQGHQHPPMLWCGGQCLWVSLKQQTTSRHTPLMLGLWQRAQLLLHGSLQVLLLMVLHRPACQLSQQVTGPWLCPASPHWLYWPRAPQLALRLRLHMQHVAVNSRDYSATDQESWLQLQCSAKPVAGSSTADAGLV